MCLGATLYAFTNVRVRVRVLAYMSVHMHVFLVHRSYVRMHDIQDLCTSINRELAYLIRFLALHK